MKKLLLILITLTSFMTRAMFRSPVPIGFSTETLLGKLSIVTINPKTEYILEKSDSGIVVGFNKETKKFYGGQYPLKYDGKLQPIEDQTVIKNLFILYQTTFDAIPQEDKHFHFYTRSEVYLHFSWMFKKE